MNVQDNKPLRGPKYRSRIFQAYLLRQTPERAAEILAGERAFGDLQKDPGSTAMAAEREHGDMLLGYEEKAAGSQTSTEIDLSHGRVPVYGSRGWAGDGG